MLSGEKAESQRKNSLEWLFCYFFIYYEKIKFDFSF